ncbi:hypothetical protein EIN_145660 [Entamoeba invadens IP1]|uniref:Uncharacterized protein n=1 Tax=Entamoeba invadens IP1 TaxID=370355 RepID=L7FKZ7_ENTIV|nr:hypothetical protein EIN_145660 [Entamoeba invadens IP1]ELP87592.1 hypothetical protein EIN_145660 [Entamoeba invadens IP1]|eukprot:XP_004254363.1 hypothetical protein EIN_145660 [Entamoeba invadens IP1]
MLFADVFDYRLLAASNLKVIAENSYSVGSVVSRDTIPSTIAVAISGDTTPLPIAVSLNEEEKMKYFNESPQIFENRRISIVDGDYLEDDDIVRWVKLLIKSWRNYDQSGVANTANQNRTERKECALLVILPKWLNNKLNSKRADFNDDNVRFVEMCNDFFDISPLGDIINLCINNIVADKTLFPDTQINKLFENKIQIVTKFLDATLVEVVKMICWPWKYLIQSKMFSVGNIVAEIKRRIESYDYITVCFPKRFSVVDPPCSSFYVNEVPQFYRGALKAFICSEEFSEATTRKQQKKMLFEVFGRFEFDFSKLFAKKKSCGIKRNMKFE